MKYVLTDKQKNALYWIIDNLIKSTFQSIIEDSEELVLEPIAVRVNNN